MAFVFDLPNFLLGAAAASVLILGWSGIEALFFEKKP